MTNNNPTERDTLKGKANLMGLEFKNNISTDKLRELVNGKLDAPEDKPLEVTKVKTLGKAIELTDQEIITQRTIELRKEMMSLKRVIVSCNDPQMKDWETTPPLCISNAILTLPKIVIPLHVEWHVPMAYYNMLKEQTCGIAVKAKDAKGRPITVRKTIQKYNVQDLNQLTAVELEALKLVQATRDGVAK